MSDSRTAAEQVLCATLLWEPTLADDIAVSHEDFADTQYGLVYRTVKYLREKGRPVSWTIVASTLRDRIDSDHSVSLADASLAQSWAAQEHASIIRNEARRRKLIRTAHHMLDVAERESTLTDETMAELEKAVAEVTATVEVEREPQHIGNLIMEFPDTLEARIKHKSDLIGVDTGFRALNAYLGGYIPGDLVVIAARPSMGKTAFMLQSAVKGSVNDAALIFSVEMSNRILLDRIVASASWTPLYDISRGKNIDDSQFVKITNAVADVGSRNLYIDDQAYATVPYIRSQVRRIKRRLAPEQKLVVFIDYLQLVKSSRRARSRHEEVAEISTDLKAMAKELGCCVVALAQLSRSVESRQDKRPMMSDIRESGQIEQDADAILFLYRDEYYNPQTERPNVVEVIIGKQRNGPVGTAEIAFEKRFQVFVDLEREG